jgi:RimJ/RimL family protein N-acetyltransferase
MLTLEEPTTHSSANTRSMELVIPIAEDHQGKGFGAEAINLGFDSAFRCAGLHGVILRKVEYNNESEREWEARNPKKY